MNTAQVLKAARIHLLELGGHIFDVLSVAKPVSPEAAVNLTKVISKLSPLVGNMIEFNTVEFLNGQPEFEGLGHWKRQDPGFPDTIFEGSVSPTPGFEIKAWFPLATEITARFKDSQNHFLQDQTEVCMLAWLPEKLIYGRPRILDVCVVSALSVAQARDNHYHKPPGYLVLEPEDTKQRTRNLQQTNTNGFKWQGTMEQLVEAKKFVAGWGSEGMVYKPTAEYQLKLRELIGRYPYRLDTNFAKMDRIRHDDIEAFKARVLRTEYMGATVEEWSRVLCSDNDGKIKEALERKLDIKEEDPKKLIR